MVKGYWFHFAIKRKPDDWIEDSAVLRIIPIQLLKIFKLFTVKNDFARNGIFR